jgi:D-xylose transport system permease protein
MDRAINTAGANERVSLKGLVRNSLKYNIRQYVMVIALVVICLIFTILTKGIFFTNRNLSNLLVQSATVAIMASGMVLVIVAGHIDISIGSALGFIGAFIAVLQMKAKMGTELSIILTLILGAVIGLWNGFWVAYRKLPAMIVTLAGMLFFRGAVYAVTGGFTMGPLNKSFASIGQGYLPKLFLQDAAFNDTSVIFAVLTVITFIIFDFNRRNSRKMYGFTVLPLKLEILKVAVTSVIILAVFSIMIFYMGIPYTVLILLAIVLVINFVAEKTVFGRHVYAIGGNRDAAKLSGINIERNNLLIFVIMGILTAIGGIVYASRINSATPAAGDSYEMNVIAAAIIGGTSTLGGEGTIYGAIVGALVMASLDNGMSLMNLGIDFQYMVKGLILLLAVWVDIATRKKAG